MSKSDLDQDLGGFDSPASSRNFVQVLWQRKAFVLLGAFVGLALGFLWHSQKVTMFATNCQLLVIKKSPANPTGNTSMDPRNTFMDDYMPTHIVLLKSPVILAQAVKKRELNNLKSFENVGDIVSVIRAGLSVERESAKETSSTGPNNILTMNYRGTVSEDCAKIISAVIEAYQDFLDVTYRNVSDQTLELITKARETIERDLKGAEKAYEKFRKDSPLIFIYGKAGINPESERIGSLEAKRTQVVNKLLEIRQRIKTLERAINDKDGSDVSGYLSQLGDRGVDRRERKEANEKIDGTLLQLKMEQIKLETTFGPDYPELKNLDTRIKVLREELTKIYGLPEEKAKDPTKLMLNAMYYEERETATILVAVDEMLEKTKLDARSLTNFEIQDHRLRNEVARYQLLYEGTVKRLAEIDLVRDAGGFEARVLAPPGVGLKVSPIASQDLSLGLAFGLLVGIGLAFLADVADKSFRSPDEIRKKLGLPLVGHIPYFQPDAESTKRRANGESTVDPMLCCYFKPKSLDSEAYRAVRTSLFFSTQGQGLKVIQVTSPNKGDGKSLLISNLAVTTAQSGKRVLLIDADCRRPRQHKVFNVSNDAGLVTVLNGEVAPREVIQETCIPGLSIMSSGPIPPNPSELLVSPRFKELLDACRNEYDYVFVDTPPLLAVTDPCIVAGKVDGLFLAIRLTRKGRPDAERAREILQSLNVRTFGIVVNGVTRTHGGLYSSQAYDYTDKYMNYEDEEDKAYYYADDDDSPKD